MANFSKALEKTLRWEGGRVDNPLDYGGRTAYGITQKTYNQYFTGDVWNIEPHQVAYIYKIGYWNKIKGDLIIDQDIAELLFDFAVNSGVRTASKKIQILVGVEADGIIGKQTIEAINKANSGRLFRMLFDVRVAYYKLIVQKNPSQKVFLRGWMNRLNSFKK